MNNGKQTEYSISYNKNIVFVSFHFKLTIPMIELTKPMIKYTS